MAHKHELMAKLQAARQTSSGIVEAESRKAYPQTADSLQMEIPLIPGQSDTLNPAPFPPVAGSVYREPFPGRR